jgi:hypothetical protein
MTATLLVLGEFRRDFPHKKLPRRVFPGILSVRGSIAHNLTNVQPPVNRLIRSIGQSRDRQTNICDSRDEA